ncbi:hypothetical protein CPC08DRAFT_724650 [Agrocybe pediades]|nr:hypothetical protein CPC08DRAFT_724650 [Agrocybe pediades]
MCRGCRLAHGYCKEYMKGKRPLGVMLDDTWLLKHQFHTLNSQQTQRFIQNQKPPPPPNQAAASRPSSMGKMKAAFGCVRIPAYRKREMDKHEPKAASANNESDRNGTPQQPKDKAVSVTGAGEGAVDVVDQLSTTPLPRYNAVLAVLRNTLYIYGGIYERGSREYTLDDFYALQLDKMEVYRCLKKSDVVIPEGEEESSSDEDDDDEDDDRDDSGEDTDDEDGKTLVDEEEMRIVVEDLAEDLDDVSLAEEEAKAPDEDEQSDLCAQATAFMGVSKDTTRSAEDVQSTPLPGETLAMFYARSPAYKPMLEKILQEAGLDEEEMRRGAAGGPALPGSEGSTSWSVETWERWNAVPLSKPVKDVAQSQLMGIPNGEWVKERGCWSED